jgi:hypothetical protein
MAFMPWLPTFLAFPLGGFLAIDTVGALHDPLSAAAAMSAGSALSAAATGRAPSSPPSC